MRLKLLDSITAAVLFLLPLTGFAQAPTLGVAANFVLFTTIGPVTNSGIPYLTHLTGNVGTNTGSSTGFGNVDGQMHDGGVTSAAAASDVTLLYGQLNSATPTFSPASPLLGNGDTLTAGVYQYPAGLATSLNLNLILDGQGNPNALFILKMGGAFSTSPGSRVTLVNGALACNVFWLVEGMIDMGAGSTMRGTMLAHNAAIQMGALDTLEGRALSISGAITTNSLLAYTPLGCGSPFLTGPAAPALGVVAPFGVFSSIGQVTSTPVTYIVGDVGSNTAAPTGFNPLNVTGTIYAPGIVTAAAVPDLLSAYNYMNALPTDIELLHGDMFGHDLVLTPHTYHISASPIAMTGSIYLNAQGNPNAIFVINMNGAFITSTLSKINLINGAQAKNVYWKVDGAVHIFDNSLFNGTLIVAGAITLNTGDTLNGRVLTINGAVAINGSYVDIIPHPCNASAIVGTDTVCVGATTLLSSADTGRIWHSGNTSVATIDSVSGLVTGISAGTAIVTLTTGLACWGIDTVLVNPTPSAITGPDSVVCVGSTIAYATLSTGGTWSGSNALIATVSNTGIVTGVAVGNVTVSYTFSSGCSTTKQVTVNPLPNAGTISGTATLCPAGNTTVSSTTSGGVWTSVNTAVATIGSSTGVVTGVAAGTSAISYTVSNSCGTDVATIVVTINPLPNAGTISGTATLCPAGNTTVSSTTSGGVWTSVNTAVATIGSSTGVVTGVAAGTSAISYTVNNSCGNDVATMVVTVNPLPNAGTISGTATLCPAGNTTVSSTTSGGVWTSVNTAVATIGSSTGVVTGVAAGTSAISYTVNNSCGTDVATIVVTVNPLPNAGTISGTATLCPAGNTTVSSTTSGGVWTSVSTAVATIGSSTGVVTGVAAGTSAISYTVNNSCGTAVATLVITVNPLPNAGGIIGNKSVCVSSTTALSDTSAGGVWTSLNSSVATIGSVTGIVAAISAGTTTISYTVINVCGTAVATAIVTVNPLPDAGVILGSSNVCVGGVITLTNTVTGGTWSSSNSTATVINGMVVGVIPGIDTIIYAKNNLCGSATSIKIITINSLPLIPVITTQAPANVCMGTMYQNFGTNVPPATNTVYSWTAVNATVWAQGSLHNNALVNFNTAGAAYVTLNTTISATGCKSQSTISINVGTGVAQTDYVSYFNRHFVCTPNNEGSYQWGYDDMVTFDSVILIGEINQDYVNDNPDFSHKLYWVMTTLGACMQKTYYKAPLTVQSADFDAFTVKVFPNPATSYINIEVSEECNGPLLVEIQNMMGQKVSSVTAIQNKATANLSGLPDGAYIISCFNNGVRISSTRFTKL